MLYRLLLLLCTGKHETLEKLPHSCQTRRLSDLRLTEVTRAGLADLAPADGAFDGYADVAAHTNDSVDFCRRMLAETGVAFTPGVDFDPARGHAAVRFSFAGSTDTMVEACRRIGDWLR